MRKKRFNVNGKKVSWKHEVTSKQDGGNGTRRGLPGPVALTAYVEPIASIQSTMNSPPSTQSTLPVTHCAFGWLSSPIASATSFGVVSRPAGFFR